MIRSTSQSMAASSSSISTCRWAVSSGMDSGKTAASFPIRTKSFSVVTIAVAPVCASLGQQSFQRVAGVGVVVGKGVRSGEGEPGGFKTGEKLLRAGNAAESGDRAVDTREFPSSGATARPAPASQKRAVRASSSGSFAGMAMTEARRAAAERLAQIARWEQFILPIPAVQEQNIHVPRELAMLKAVVQQVNDGRGNPAGGLLRFGLGQQTGVVALGSHVDGNACLAGNQQRFIAKFRGGSLRIDADSELALAAVAAGEHVHAQAAPVGALRPARW